MSSITATAVKELRDLTGAGFIDCKNALQSTNGNIEAAIELLRKSGLAKAAKKAGRIAAEGAIIIKNSSDGKKAFMLEINCETDFVARDASFIAFANKVAELGLSAKAANLESLVALNFADSKTIAQACSDLVSKIGENINLRRVIFMESNGIVGSYIHSNNRIGVLVDLSIADKDLAKDLAMHIAASRPLTITADELPPELLAKEEEIIKAQVQETKKPPEIIARMVGGRLQKFVSEVTLLNQPFVKNPDICVSALLKDARVLNFYRYEVGEGIEKKIVDFASEVKAQIEGTK